MGFFDKPGGRYKKKQGGCSAFAETQAKAIRDCLIEHQGRYRQLAKKTIAEEIDKVLRLGAMDKARIGAAVKWGCEHYKEEYCAGIRSRMGITAALLSWDKMASSAAPSNDKLKEMFKDEF